MNTNSGILQNEILNILSDDGENIIQIEQQCRYFNIPHSRKNIKYYIDKMLHEELIYIAYPNKEQKNDFINLKWESRDIENYWFELTKKGHEYLKNIKF